MLASKYFFYTIRNTSQQIQESVSNDLLTRAGFVHQVGNGMFSILPIGLRVIKKIEQIIIEEQKKINAEEVLIPLIQESLLWKKSGRIDSYGQEMLKIKDRKDRELIFAPTNEEQITDILAQKNITYKQLPILMFAISQKFRDEIRPKHGLMRAKEFIMKDTYSFDATQENAHKSYWRVALSYFKTFARMNLKIVMAAADSGAIGGELNHEFVVVHSGGETKVEFKKENPLNLIEKIETIKNEDQLKIEYENFEAQITEKENQTNILNGTEVGHVFYFGQKYSESLKASFMNEDGKNKYYEMGSYGIGITRLMATVVEVNHDKNGILWPANIAPFQVVIIRISDDEKSSQLSQEVYQKLINENIDVLLDDRKQSMGVKLSEMDLIGIPIQVIIGKKEAEKNTLIIKERKNLEKQ